MGVFAAKNRELQRSSDNQLNGNNLHLLQLVLHVFPYDNICCLSVCVAHRDGRKSVEETLRAVEHTVRYE